MYLGIFSVLDIRVMIFEETENSEQRRNDGIRRANLVK